MKKIIAQIFIVLIFISGSSSVHAQQTYTLLEPLPCIEGVGNNCTNSEGKINTITEVTVDQYITYVYKLAIALAVFLATVMIIWGGFEWMLSEVPFTKLSGKKRITDAVFGLTLTLISYLVLQTIDPRLVLVKTKLDPIKITRDDGYLETELSKDLVEMKAADRAEINNLTTQNAEISKSLSALEEAKKNGTITEEQEKNLEGLKLDYKRNLATVDKKAASLLGADNFNKILNELHKNETYTRGVINNAVHLTENAETQLAGLKTQLDSMSKYISNLRKLGDLEGAQAMEERRKYYNRQIEAEKQLWIDMKTYLSFSGSTKEAAKKSLDESLALYSQPATTGLGTTGNSYDKELFKINEELRKNRVENLNAVLHPPAKK